MTVSDAKRWLEGMQNAFSEYQGHNGLFTYEDWVIVSPHAVTDYPCREIPEFYLLRLLRAHAGWAISSTRLAQRLLFATVDPDETLPTNRRKLEVIIEFSAPVSTVPLPNRAVVVSVWRENSPKVCCWNASGKVPLCIYAQKTLRKI